MTYSGEKLRLQGRSEGERVHVESTYGARSVHEPKRGIPTETQYANRAWTAHGSTSHTSRSEVLAALEMVLAPRLGKLATYSLDRATNPISAP